MLALRYFPANAAYAFTFGGPAIRDMQMLQMSDSPMFYRTRREAVLSARAHGLDVCRNGEVISREPDFSFA